MDGLAARLARNVPKGDVEAGEGEDQRTIAAAALDAPVQVEHQRANVVAGAAHRHGRDDALNGEMGHWAAGEAETFAPAGEARIRIHANVDGVHGGAHAACALGGHRRSMVEGNGQMEGFDFRDLHPVISPFPAAGAPGAPWAPGLRKGVR